jgi:DNA (cytosine-5)-methyltransferase 1
MGLVSAFLEQANGGFYDGDGRDVREPVSTICASGANQRLVAAYLVKYYGAERDGVALDGPMHTIPTKDRMGLIQCVQVAADTLAPELRERAKAVADFLHEYLPEHFRESADMVLLGGYVLADITLRMLAPRELARAQGFPDSYILDRGLFETAPGSGEYEWRAITKTDQVRLIGNSVCQDMAAAEVANDLADLIEFYARAA